MEYTIEPLKIGVKSVGTYLFRAKKCLDCPQLWVNDRKNMVGTVRICSNLRFFCFQNVSKFVTHGTTALKL